MSLTPSVPASFSWLGCFRFHGDKLGSFYEHVDSRKYYVVILEIVEVSEANRGDPISIFNLPELRELPGYRQISKEAVLEPVYVVRIKNFLVGDIVYRPGMTNVFLIKGDTREDSYAMNSYGGRILSLAPACSSQDKLYSFMKLRCFIAQSFTAGKSWHIIPLSYFSW